MIHLHTHTHYSLLDGLSTVQDVLARVKELGAPAVAITDHGNISAMPEFLKEAKAAGIKPIMGCEFYLVDDVEARPKGERRYHMTVWAKNWAGVQSIMAQLTLANAQFFYRPRLNFDQALNFKNCCVGTACCGGILSCDDYEEKVLLLKEAYGEDLYLEIMPHRVIEGDVDLQRIATERAMNLAERFKIKLLATNDAHYIADDDYFTHNVFKAISYGKTMAEMETEGWGRGFYMRSVSEMVMAFRDLGYVPDAAIGAALKNTGELIGKCMVEMPDFKIDLPAVYRGDDEQVFQQACIDGWKKKITGKVGPRADEYHKRLVYEIGVIKRMGFIRYFLMVQDIIKWAEAHGIMVGPARGSAAGSLVCYLMGITQVDPIKHGLYFERFLNPERVSLPDIDCDFQDDRRQEVFDYIVNKYGADKVGHITTFGVLSAKSAFRDVASRFGVKTLMINLLSKQIEDEDSFDTVPDLIRFKEKYPMIVEQTKKLSGRIRQAGMHACGIVVGSRPLQNVCVLERRNTNLVTCWDKDQVEKFGLLKMDILGLSTLGVLSYARELILRRRDTEIDFEQIPLDDAKTLEVFKNGDGVGVFQFENSGMQSLLKSLNPESFETVTATTALYRPGSLNSGQTSRYVAIAQGHEYEKYDPPQLEPILKNTKGVLVYQEQIMRIFVELGGFTWAGADTMRKIIGKKLGKDEFEKHRVAFVAGCVKNHIDEAQANRLFGQMAEFAEYSFNKCMHGGTMVELADGSKKMIRDLYEASGRTGNIHVSLKCYNPNKDKIEANTTMKVVRTGRRSLLRIATKSGRVIYVTREHKMFAEGYKEIKAGELKVGDKLMVKNRV